VHPPSANKQLDMAFARAHHFRQQLADLLSHSPAIAKHKHAVAVAAQFESALSQCLREI
jgi:hypothetical protein